MYVSGTELAVGYTKGEGVFAAFRSLLSYQQDSPAITKIVCQELWEESLQIIVKNIVESS